MADPGGPGFGPGDGYGYGYFNQSGIPASSSFIPSVATPSGGSSTLPVWTLVLIMLASGLVTLFFLWLCVLFICRKRRARQLAAVRADVEVQTTWAADFRNPSPFGPKDLDLSNAKRLEADNVELTYVVMAGENQPSFLARPAANITSPSPSPSKESSPESPSPSPSPPTALDVAVEAVAVDAQKTPSPS